MAEARSAEALARRKARKAAKRKENRRTKPPSSPSPMALTRARATAAAKLRRGTITIAALRAEGVQDFGRPEGTSLLFVRTGKSLRLFHASALPDRHLDTYAITLAVGWLSNGFSAGQVASNLDVSVAHLMNELKRYGYERQSLNDRGPRKGADQRERNKTEGSRGDAWTARYKGNRQGLTLVKRLDRTPEASQS